ncbi:MAG: hypothetical protein VX624_10610 [Pseudomonadota bacterium]|nr:hypothetical protein [Pseudomonadota bacterium]
MWLIIRAGQTRIVGYWQLWILPAAIFAVSFTSILAIEPDTSSVASWIFGIAAGCGLGWSFHRDETLRVDRKHGLLWFEREWKTLILIIIVFVYGYYWGYKTATAPELVTIPGVALNYVGFNGILTGLFIGWRLHTFYVYRMGPTEDLTIADVEASPTD